MPMTREVLPAGPRAARTASSLLTLALVAGWLAAVGCASMPSSGGRGSATADMSTLAPSPDPRAGLSSGGFNAGEAIWNLQKVSTTPPSAQFINMAEPGATRLYNSDLAFTGPYVIQGNYSGYQI